MRSLILFILLEILGFPVKCQLIYFQVHDSIAKYSDTYSIELSNCSISKECDNQAYNNFSIRSFDNSWYVIDWAPILGWYDMNGCIKGKWGGTIKPSNILFLEQGQWSDRNGFIWCFGSSGMIKINPPTSLFEYKGPIDISQFAGLGWSTLIDGSVYSSSALKSDRDQRLIIKFDTNNLIAPQIICLLPSGFMEHGLFTSHISCGVNDLIIVEFGSNKLYKVNIQTCSLDYLCDINLPIESQNSDFFGTGYWHYNPHDCDVFLDLDINNSSGDKRNGFINKLSCNKELPLLTDVDPDVFSDYGTMDSLIISILNPLDGKQETILFQNNYSISSVQSINNLKLLPQILSTNDSFELAIRSLRYSNISCFPSTGTRFIQFIVYKNGLCDTAICSLQLDGPFYNAGMDTSIVVCKDAERVNLYPLLGPCFSPGGLWYPILNIQGQYDPNLDIDSIYYYVVGDSICGYDSAKITIKSIQIPYYKLPGDTVLCEGDVLQFNYNLPGINLLWNDGTTFGQKTVTSTGLYWLQLTNQDGCSYRDSMYIEFKPLSKIFRRLSICENERFEYKNQFYQVGDIIRDTIRHSLSCDSLIEIELLGIPVPAIKLLGDTLICPNTQSLIQTVQNFSKYYWSTQDSSVSQLLSPGYYTLQVIDSNGCSNLITFTIHESPEIKYELKVNDPLCIDDSGSILLKLTSGGVFPIRYLINGQENQSGIFNQLNSGLYIAQIIDSNNCSTMDTIQIKQASGFEIEMQDHLELEFGSNTVIYYKVKEGIPKQIRILPDRDIIQYGITGFQVNALEDTYYEIQFEDSNGCIIIKTLNVKIRQNNELFLPTAFTPNGDQINDFWEPWIAPASKLIIAKIFNRWGEIVYVSKTEVKWDGRFKDSNCSPGVYIYYLEIQQGNKNKIIKSGDFTLFR
ncbi:MAG: gliding motility-associated C-terminal domain-containing protein [Saprospiraceae bacterium]|jgi:gliding motility-associated-like protein